MKKKQSPEQQLKAYRAELKQRFQLWRQLRNRGGSDPCWSDGVNMHLVRNHILYYRAQIQNLCEQTGAPRPCVLQIPVPPEVHKRYYAAGNQYFQTRVQRMRQYGEQPVCYVIRMQGNKRSQTARTLCKHMGVSR